MRPSMATVLKEIQVSLGFYKSQHPEARFSRIVVTGRGFLVKGLPNPWARGRSFRSPRWARRKRGDLFRWTETPSSNPPTAWACRSVWRRRSWA